MEANINAEVEGLRRSRLFDSVDVVTANDTLKPDIADYPHLLWYQVGTTGPNFTGRWYGG
jgi:hypothetical protein